jgi:soluble lytic murein transglycosylase-like protein
VTVIRVVLSAPLLLLAFSLPARAEGKESIETSLRRAFSTLQQQQEEKVRNTLNSLTEQVQSDLEPAKRIQAAIMLAAHYWDSNFRLSRHYLGIAESLRDPTLPELKRFDPEIEHLKIRFRHAALLDRDTKSALEQQLARSPQEPLRLSLVEMLLETNQALGLTKDYLDVYRRYYTSYPRTIKKDRFLRKAAEIYNQNQDLPRYFQQLEGLLDQYPVTVEAQWALEQLLRYTLQPAAASKRYAFTFGLLKKVYRNASHDPAQQKRIAEVFTKPLRKNAQSPAQKLDAIDTIKFYCFLGIYDEALSFAQGLLNQPSTLAPLKLEILNWVAFINSEKGEHQSALAQFQAVPRPPLGDLVFRESAAKSLMSSQNFAEAANEYRNLLKSKDHHRYRWYYFWNLLASGRLENAQAFVDRTPDRMFNEPEFRQDAALYWRGRTLISAGRLSEARSVLAPILQQPKPGYYGIMAKAALNHGEALAKQNQRSGLPDQATTEGQDVSPPPPGNAKAIPANFQNGERPIESRIAVEGIPFANHVYEVAKVAEVDPYLILSIIRSESGFNSRALSAAGAQGLMQIMPYTAVRLARLLDDREFSLDQLQLADTNLLYGSLYLTLLLQYYGGHPIPAVAAYNAGPLAVNKWLRECRNCPVDAFVEFIPFAETRNYVKKVMSTYTSYRLIESHHEMDFLQRELPTETPRDISIF